MRKIFRIVLSVVLVLGAGSVSLDHAIASDVTSDVSVTRTAGVAAADDERQLTTRWPWCGFKGWCAKAGGW